MREREREREREGGWWRRRSNPSAGTRKKQETGALVEVIMRSLYEVKDHLQVICMR